MPLPRVEDGLEPCPLPAAGLSAPEAGGVPAVEGCAVGADPLLGASEGFAVPAGEGWLRVAAPALGCSAGLAPPDVEGWVGAVAPEVEGCVVDPAPVLGWSPAAGERLSRGPAPRAAAGA